MVSELRITVSNQTSIDLDPCDPVPYATTEGRISAPPRVIPATEKDTGGVYAFDTSLCAVSAYKSPIGDYVWVLFVQTSQSRWTEPIVKTSFYPAGTIINSGLINDIKNNWACKDTATHKVSGVGMSLAYQARCWATGPVSVEFELGVTADNPSKDREDRERRARDEESHRGLSSPPSTSTHRGTPMSSELTITVSNHTAIDLDPYGGPAPFSTTEGSISVPPRIISASEKDTGGVFTFDKKLCAISAYQCPIGDHVWILFVQAKNSRRPEATVKTVFCPPRTTINPVLVDNIKNGWAYKDTATHDVSIAGVQVTYQARCWVAGPLSVEFELTVVPADPSKAPIFTGAGPHRGSSQADSGSSDEGRDSYEEDSDADHYRPGVPNPWSLPRPPSGVRGAAVPSKISITVLNETREAIRPCQPLCYATVPNSLNSTPPEDVAAGNRGSGGVFTFDPNLCAISAYATPDPNYIWILFVRARSRNDLIVKTVFYLKEKRVDQVLVNDIKNTSAHEDSATHTFTASGLDVTFEATRVQRTERHIGRDETLSVEFKLTATAKNPAENSHRNPSSSTAQPSRYDEGGSGYRRDTPNNRGSRRDARPRDRDGFGEYVRRSPW